MQKKKNPCKCVFYRAWQVLGIIKCRLKNSVLCNSTVNSDCCCCKLLRHLLAGIKPLLASTVLSMTLHKVTLSTNVSSIMTSQVMQQISTFFVFAGRQVTEKIVKDACRLRVLAAKWVIFTNVSIAANIAQTAQG